MWFLKTLELNMCIRKSNIGKEKLVINKTQSAVIENRNYRAN